MRRALLTLLWMSLVNGTAPAEDSAAAVRAVFSAKCAGCHGPTLEKPRGRFGYVLDLARVAGNPEMVVPGAPDQSELWELVRRGEMPPADSPTGPLTADEKETVRAWIDAGAPATASARPPATAAEPAALPSFLGRLGRLHVVLVHFPIALLIAAAAREAWSTWRGRSTPTAAVHFCVVFGAVASVVAAAFGWLYAAGGAGATMPAVLALHRWLGTVTAGWAVLTAALSARDERRGVRSGAFRAALLIAAGLVGTTGHLGGTLVFGPHFFMAA
jgi:mono/diheme cytochrome c family protein/uncharacterized membrane protein